VDVHCAIFAKAASALGEAKNKNFSHQATGENVHDAKRASKDFVPKQLPLARREKKQRSL
tara:strand:+ start:75 stop:254 length:180 start_codon:yes stop_codon:yes gene_type:complete